MITIKQEEENRIFASGAFFERSEQIHESINECSYEELMDLCKYLLTKMENAYGNVEQTQLDLAKSLGWGSFI